MKTKMYAGQYSLIQFPGGEPHVKVLRDERPALIDARVRSFNDLGELLVLTDALRREGGPIRLRLPYFPGARQDRALRGEALTVKVYADIINAQGYDRVEILDPHSPVVVALIDRVRVLSPLPAIKTFVAQHGITHLISPDAGAEKRVWDVATILGLPVIHGSKHRDMETGKLSGFGLERPPGPGRYLIVDDICDGGGTFIGLAETFKQQASAGWGLVQPSLFLWVTHGIFSRGIEVLLEHFEAIGTTDSFYEGPTSDRVSVCSVENVI
jgi:ribose-phosphate pyrophosphokinase